MVTGRLNWQQKVRPDPSPEVVVMQARLIRLGWALIVRPGLDPRVGQGETHQAELYCKMCRAGLDLEQIFFLNEQSPITY